MTLKTTLLAGVALCGLAASPALARDEAPQFRLAISPHTGMALHVKTAAGHARATNFTETATFSGSLSTKADYKKKVVLLGDTWYNTATCAEPKKESWTGLPKKTLYATISTSTSTGTLTSCPGTTFTFRDIDYTLVSKKGVGKTDAITGDLVAKNFQGYNLKLVAHINVAITK